MSANIDIDTTADPPIEYEEAQRRMPTIEFIDTHDIRVATTEAVQDRPAYFWEAPTTTSEQYHNQYTRGEYGLWIHTMMVSTALERLLDSHRVPAIDIERMSQREADNLRAAAILHDGQKYGIKREDGDSAATDHELLIAEELDDRGFDAVAVEAVRTHMGPFERYEGPVPGTPGSWLLHRADMVASDPFTLPAVYNPPEELLDAHPTLPRYYEGDQSVSQSPPEQQSLYDYEDETTHGGSD